MAYRESTSRRNRQYLVALRAGLLPRQIASKYRVGLRTVYDGISRARLAERPAGPPPHSPSLTVAYGASCKALRLLRCQDVHPCPCLRRRGSNGKGCPLCNWTGISPIPKGSAICCAVCHVSGKDGHPALRVHPSDPQPERRVEPRKQKPTRKERRRRIAVEHLEPSPN